MPNSSVAVNSANCEVVWNYYCHRTLNKSRNDICKITNWSWPPHTRNENVFRFSEKQSQTANKKWPEEIDNAAQFCINNIIFISYRFKCIQAAHIFPRTRWESPTRHSSQSALAEQ